MTRRAIDMARIVLCGGEWLFFNGHGNGAEVGYVVVIPKGKKSRMIITA
jgi:hypothetical protein